MVMAVISIKKCFCNKITLTSPISLYAPIEFIEEDLIEWMSKHSQGTLVTPLL